MDIEMTELESDRFVTPNEMTLALHSPSVDYALI